jgi:hypothetical protein
LTNFKLVFIPYEQEDIENESLKVFTVDTRLNMFANKTNSNRQLDIVIPLGFVYDIKASSISSDKKKYRKLKSYIDNNNSPAIKDILIKCKNFMIKCFTFDDHVKDEENISKFCEHLALNSNYQSIIHSRFFNLIHEFNVTMDHATTAKYEADDDDYDDNKNNQKQMRKSYLVPSDLMDDIIDSNCDAYICVKSGYAEVIPNKFIIDTTMPFFAIPNNILDILARRRVVINEGHVLEFNGQDTNRSSTLSASTKKSKRFSELNSSSGPINQAPIMAPLTTFNPFFDNRFLVIYFFFEISKQILQTTL